MKKFAVYFKANEDDNFGTFFTIVEAATIEEAEKIAERLYAEERGEEIPTWNQDLMFN